MRKTIHVAFCIDNTFAIHLAVLIHSLGQHLDQCFKLECHILGRLNENNKLKLSALISRNIAIQFHDDFPDYKNIPISSLYKNRLNEVTYYRFAIPEVLYNIDKVLFIDADMIAVGDISPLWSIEMGDAVVAVVSDHILGCDKEKQQERGISSGKYFNAGFMMMDLIKWRKNNISMNAMDLLVANNGFEHNDQDALNIVLENKALYLEYKWNAQPDYILKDLNITPVLVHFCGQEKPWHVSSIHPYTIQYLSYKEKTPYKGMPLECYLDNDDHQLLKRLLISLPSGGRVAVWGAGQRGRRVCYYLKYMIKNYQLVYIIDKHVQGSYLDVDIKKEIIDDEEIDAIIIASVPYRDEIIKEINAMTTNTFNII